MPTLRDWVEIFRAGKYPQGTYTVADLHKIANSYDPVSHYKAPITLDHIQKGRAYGKIAELKVKGNALYAKFENVAPQLNEWIREGAYQERSVELTKELYLKACTFLGAAPPAVKGMEEIQPFSEAGVVVFSEQREEDDSDSSILENITQIFSSLCNDFTNLISKFKEESTSSPENQNNTNTNQEDATEVTEEEMKKIAEMTAGMLAGKPNAGGQGEVNKFSEENEGLKVLLAKMQREKRQAEFKSFSEGLIDQGKILPKHVEKLESLYLSFGETTEASEVIKFGELNETASRWDVVKDILEAVPAKTFGEVGGGRKYTSDKANPPETSNFAGGDEFFEKVKAFADKHNISFSDAYDRIDE